MLIELLYVLFVTLSFLIIFIVLLQKSKGSLGLSGALGGHAQAMFGGSGGQDVFQRTTWIFIACFMGGSLVLAILKNRSVNLSRYFSGEVAQLITPQQMAPNIDQTQAPVQAQPEPTSSTETTTTTP